MQNPKTTGALTRAGTRIATAVAVVAVMGSTAGAQITQLSRTPIQDAAQLTFGYLCDDRFVVRNDGTAPVDLEYGLAKGGEHTKVQLGAREVLELESKSKEAMELWHDGKRIATAEKQRRKCTEGDNLNAMVRPIDSGESRAERTPYSGAWPYYDPFYSPWGYSSFYGSGLAFGRYYPGVVAYPVIVGGGGRVVRGNGGGRR